MFKQAINGCFIIAGNSVASAGAVRLQIWDRHESSIRKSE
ncbi:hypothetical protein CPter91_2638 [Collimonas pratensis]|uniref:Uncharacterized protein n=1 Tax=Collimonas pratensis TaxID=279113 RepID=A0A127Q4L6_9BURK|nr:hypothetical protein CPter91_2638 [Collimonas pratensis]